MNFQNISWTFEIWVNFWIRAVHILCQAKMGSPDPWAKLDTCNGPDKHIYFVPWMFCLCWNYFQPPKKLFIQEDMLNCRSGNISKLFCLTTSFTVIFLKIFVYENLIFSDKILPKLKIRVSFRKKITSVFLSSRFLRKDATFLLDVFIQFLVDSWMTRYLQVQVL